jgi:multisubunit Na+/H+ antiporter MnhE subunit
MASFWLVIMAGLTWMALMNETSLGTFALGVLMGVVVWQLEHLRTRQRFSIVRVLRSFGPGLVLLGHFFVEIIGANLEQLRIVSAPKIAVEPRWIRMRTDLVSPATRATLGLMVAMTPGTVCCEELEEPDGGFSIGIHALSARDDDSVVSRIRERFEAPLLRMESL